MGIFRKQEVREVETPNESTEMSDPLLEILLSNADITKDKALNTPAISACVNKISDIIAMLPIKLYKREADDTIEITDDYRVQLLNLETGDTLDSTQMKKAVIVDYFLGQGGYIYIHRLGNKILSLHYVDESEISFLTNEDPIFKDYKILVRGRQYESFDFIKMLRATKNGYNSTSIIQENKIPFLLGYQTAVFEKTLLESGGNKRGFLQSNKKLTKEAMTLLKSAFRNLYSNNKENVVVLNDGLTFKESSSSSTELQLDENKASNNNNICKIFNVPPSILNGTTNSTDERMFITNCIMPIITRFETALNKDLLLEDEKSSYFFAFDITEFEKADIEKRYKAYEIAAKEGIMQIDEIRKKENLKNLNLDFVKLGLQDVLYDPVSKTVFTPNTGISTDLDNAGTTDEPANIDEKNDKGGVKANED